MARDAKQSEHHPSATNPETTGHQSRLARLRDRRVFAPRDESLAFMKQAFKQDVARPFRQLEGVTEAWSEHIPEALRRCSRLESLQRGVLTVVVDSPATHFLFDEHVRRGLAVKLAETSGGAVLRKIRLRVDASAFADEPNDGSDMDHGPYDAEADFDPELPR
ncbi:MAG: DciA family protein [Planctomycetota bacterium]